MKYSAVEGAVKILLGKCKGSHNTIKQDVGSGWKLKDDIRHWKEKNGLGSGSLLKKPVILTRITASMLFSIWPNLDTVHHPDQDQHHRWYQAPEAEPFRSWANRIIALHIRSTRVLKQSETTIERGIIATGKKGHRSSMKISSWHAK